MGSIKFVQIWDLADKRLDYICDVKLLKLRGWGLSSLKSSSSDHTPQAPTVNVNYFCNSFPTNVSVGQFKAGPRLRRRRRRRNQGIKSFIMLGGIQNFWFRDHLKYLTFWQLLKNNFLPQRPLLNNYHWPTAPLRADYSHGGESGIGLAEALNNFIPNIF